MDISVLITKMMEVGKIKYVLNQQIEDFKKGGQKLFEEKNKIKNKEFENAKTDILQNKSINLSEFNNKNIHSFEIINDKEKLSFYNKNERIFENYELWLINDEHYKEKPETSKINININLKKVNNEF